MITAARREESALSYARRVAPRRGVPGPRYREARSTKRGPVSVRVVSKKIVERLDGRRKPRTDFCAVDYCTVVVTRGWSMKTVLASNPRMGNAISAALGRIWSCTVRDD